MSGRHPRPKPAPLARAHAKCAARATLVRILSKSVLHAYRSRNRSRVWRMIHVLVAFGPRVISYKPPRRGRCMTGNSSTAGRETFDASLLACVEDINKLLPGLSRRYDLTVIMTALAEHVGSALKVLMHKQVCDALQARRVIKNIES